MSEEQSKQQQEKKNNDNNTKEGVNLSEIEFLLDIPLEVTVELGRAKMLLKDLLQMGEGSIVELEKLADEPLDILVNNRLVARGEAVVVNEKFGIKISEIISPAERVKQLK